MKIVSPAGDSVEGLIVERLTEAGLPGSVEDLVLAVLLGDSDLDAVLSDGSSARPSLQPEAGAAAEPVRTYLQSIVVQGFRGIGPQAALRLQPGPGLTVIAGRNGSGKSSFAEAAELALTGDNQRWAGRTAVWREGWRNLHAGDSPRIEIGLAADGQPGVLKVVSEWPPGVSLDGATVCAQRPGQQRQPLDSLGWSGALQVYRPFLSYSELGALVTGRPSEMYDALQSILGMNQLIDAERRLSDARRRFDTLSKEAKQALPALLDWLKDHPDERARRAEKALRGQTWDLATVRALAGGGEPADSSLAERLQQVAALSLPTHETITAAVQRLEAAQQGVGRLAGTPAADARRLAGLLTAALDHHSGHRDEPCPVCGGRVLDEAWAASTSAEIERLNATAADAEAAHAELTAATREIRALIPAEPTVLSADIHGEIDPAPLREAWHRSLVLAAEGSPEQLAKDTADYFAVLSAALDRAREQARHALHRRSEAWQPIAAALAAWEVQAQQSQRAAATLANIKKARDWLKETGNGVRNARMAPIAATSAQVWQMLRQESNVDLGPIRLEGASTQRRVILDVAVDGIPGAALSVMSQGELHALGLALFLPRATAPESPFRFLIIDDPVQSMDPAKVDGLARLLSQTAQHHQVIVFTHDDRLPEAIRRLQLPATIWEVARRERSVVELKKNDDPVTRYLDDAHALARTEDLSEEARRVVVAGFCRSALEAACQEKARAHRLAAGAGHADVERVLAEAHTLNQTVALALFDDPGRAGDVMPRLGQYGSWAVNAFKVARTGTHAAYPGDLKALVSDVSSLATKLRA